MINIGTQGIHTGHEYVDTQVKLQLVYQVGLVQVPLGYIVLTGLQPLVVSCQKNSLALAACLGLHYECFSLLVIELGFEILGVLGKEPSFGEKVEIRRTCLLDGHKVLRQEVLSGQGIHPWEVISALIQLHLQQECRCDWAVYPINVPILLLVVAQCKI